MPGEYDAKRNEAEELEELSPCILDAIADPNVFAPAFRDQRSWQAWFAFLAALFGLPLTARQQTIFQQCTGRSKPPTSRLYEAWLIVGRRGGKSFILALIAVFLGCFKDWRPYLGPPRPQAPV